MCIPQSGGRRSGEEVMAEITTAIVATLDPVFIAALAMGCSTALVSLAYFLAR
jgi:hypothetical protein